MSFNKIILVGHLGRDAELRSTPQGNSVCTFSLATNERRRAASDAQEDITITTWFRVRVWGPRAETMAKYLTKGKPVYVEGRLHVEEWTDREHQRRYTLDVNATDVQFIDSPAREEKGTESESYASGARSAVA